MESNEQNQFSTFAEESVGYRYGQQVRVLDKETNEIAVGTVKGIMSIDKLECCSEYRPGIDLPTITVDVTFTTVINQRLDKNGRRRDITFIVETKAAEWDSERYKLLD
jgi:hypothetical protein